MDEIAKIIGDNIRKLRSSRKMTRESLAESLDLDTAYLGQCERGERQLGLAKTIETIKFFGVTPNDIISINIRKSNKNKEQYLNDINNILDNCSDNQLLAILNCINPLIPFLKD